ncbi:MAG TPA: GNAT family N-acetyltransferase [Trebonia sp.]|nr:GNAT family N-acetyltransferase [Trebonia sp.]
MSGGFVRAARAADAEGLARVQVVSWRAAFAGLVPDAVISELTSESAAGQFAERWRDAISAPPTSKHRVHVAVEKPGDPDILGFAAAGPASDEDLWAGTDGELYELHVVPSAAGAGHDQRLLNAVADTFAEDGFSTGYTWALSGDEARIGFLEAAGWAPDGSRSNLDMGVKVPMVRLHTRVGSAGG